MTQKKNRKNKKCSRHQSKKQQKKHTLHQESMSHDSAAASINKSSAQTDTPLLQRTEILNSFLHQNIIVGVAQNNFKSTVGVEGRLDAVDHMCNVVLANATSPALGNQGTSKVGAVRGASVMFFGIPKPQQAQQD